MAERDLSPTSTSSMLSNITVQTDKQADARAMFSASPSISTPPTSLDDEVSVLSDTTKLEQTTEVFSETPTLETPRGAREVGLAAENTANSEGRRSARNSRKSVTTYNVQILAGTAIHTPTKYLEKHHKNVLHGSLQSIAKKDNVAPAKKRIFKPGLEGTDASDPVEEQLATEAAQAARRRTSSRVIDLRKEAFRNLSSIGDAVANTLSGKIASVQGSLRRSASDPRLKSARSPSSTSPLKRRHTATDTEDGIQNTQEQDDMKDLKPKSKVWLKQGLYVGQHRNFDARLSESQNRAKKRARIPRESGVLPLPIFACDRLLNEDPRYVFRDFKLPFDTYSPLPRKVKVDGWVKLHKNRFIGDASALWKRDKQDASQCYCDPEDGCGEACHNRIMAYECDNTNCRLSAEQCGNRPFAELRRRAKGNRYDYGVEVADTDNRGYGVRAMRTFEPHQIIVEYAGEIITQSECERRMKQVYKKDKCYYLMSFDNKMIIDATRGTIARFVNHSCEPNCEMIKWTVGGAPRMALFAGPRGVMTGDELTYDYNFDPFSQKNIQVCRCGTQSCRGVLGPKPKKPVEEKPVTSGLFTGIKRKAHQFLSSGRAGSESLSSSPKKRKLDTARPTTTKAKNASDRYKFARERAEREATEHSRQIASREDRALKRSVSEAAFRRARSTKLRSTKSASVTFTRRTTASFQHRVLMPHSLKAARQPAIVHPVGPHGNLSGNSKNGVSSLQRPSTPIQSSDPAFSESEEDTSPNITPASLRSASRISKQLNTDVQEHPVKTKPSKVGVERSRARRAIYIAGYKSQQRSAVSTLGKLHRTGPKIDVVHHPVQSRSRNMRGRFLPKNEA